MFIPRIYDLPHNYHKYVSTSNLNSVTYYKYYFSKKFSMVTLLMTWVKIVEVYKIQRYRLLYYLNMWRYNLCAKTVIFYFHKKMVDIPPTFSVIISNKKKLKNRGLVIHT